MMHRKLETNDIHADGPGGGDGAMLASEMLVCWVKVNQM